MMKMEAGQPTYFEWIKDNVPKGSTIGMDIAQVPAKSFETRKKYFEEHGINLVGTQTNLVDEVWADEKPALPKAPVWILEEKYAGETTLQKFDRIAEKMDKKANMMLVTALDDIAWVLNLRGSDIEYNPIFFSYLLLHREGASLRAELFIDSTKIQEPEIQDYLKANRVTVYGYDEIESVIKKHQSQSEKGVSVYKDLCNQKLVQLL
jgi:Xaa-Pro aminopeptidase